MDSEDRRITFGLSAMFATIVAVVFMVSSCVVDKQAHPDPATALQVKSDHMLKAYCARQRGEWTTKDQNGYNVDGHCSFITK